MTRRVTVWGGCALLSLGPFSLAACQDDPTGPGSVLVSVETRSAIQILGELPELDDLYPEADSAELRTWQGSWEMGPARGRVIRASVYERVANQPGRPTTNVDGVSGAVDQVRAAVNGVKNVGDDLPLHLALPIGESERFLARALSARGQGQWGDASLLILKSADALREVMPKSVAWSLIETAEAALAESPLREGVTEVTATRAKRLVRWARSAVLSNSHPRAIQRAYYACRLAGVILP